jgi:hypothetical protein
MILLLDRNRIGSTVNNNARGQKTLPQKNRRKKREGKE